MNLTTQGLLWDTMQSIFRHKFRGKRYIQRHWVMALLLLGLLSVVVSCATMPVSFGGDICSIFSAKRDWHKSALRAQKKWQMPVHVPMAVMYHESKFRSRAKPPRRYIFGVIPWKRRSTAYGYAQAVDGTWLSYQKETNHRSASRTDFADAIDFIGWYTNKTAVVNKIAKTDAYHQYIAYHEGWGGYKSMKWKQKSWLKRVASEVDQRAARYAEQYRRCAKDLDKPFWRRWFS